VWMLRIQFIKSSVRRHLSTNGLMADFPSKQMADFLAAVNSCMEDVKGDLTGKF
jgi:hypothetical protein